MVLHFPPTISIARTKPLNTTDTDIKPSTARSTAYSINPGLKAMTVPVKKSGFKT